MQFEKTSFKCSTSFDYERKITHFDDTCRCQNSGGNDTNEKSIGIKNQDNCRKHFIGSRRFSRLDSALLRLLIRNRINSVHKFKNICNSLHSNKKIIVLKNSTLSLRNGN